MNENVSEVKLDRLKTATLLTEDGKLALLYNANAMKDILARYGGLAPLDEILKDQLLVVAEIPWLVTLLANQYIELYNSENPDRKELISEEKLRLSIQPYQLKPMAEAVIRAINAGVLGIEDDEDEEVDEVLQEIRKNARSARGKTWRTYLCAMCLWVCKLGLPKNKRG